MHDPNGLPSLAGKVAVVTGAGGGVGGGIARRLAAAGADLVLHYRTAAGATEELAEELAGELAGEHGGRSVTVQGDLVDPGACDALVAAAADSFGRLDVLVNNAGVQPVQDLAGMTADEWRAVVGTNTTATFAATQAAVPLMREAGGGSIIHIASIEGSHPQRSHAHYCASKAAIIMHARTAALEYGPYGIRVNTVSPGLINRDGLAEAWPEGVERWGRAAPLRRLGRAEDVGNACVFLASPMGEWITGQDLIVDGGVSVNPTW